MRLLKCLVFFVCMFSFLIGSAQNKKLKKSFDKGYKYLAKQKFYKASSTLETAAKRLDSAAWTALEKTEYYTLLSTAQYPIGNGDFIKRMLASAAHNFETISAGTNPDELLRLKKGILSTALQSGFYSDVENLIEKSAFDANRYNLAFPPSVSCELLRVAILTEQGFIFNLEANIGQLAQAQLDIEKALSDKVFMRGIGKTELLEIEDNYARLALLQIRLLELAGSSEKAIENAELQEENILRILGKGSIWDAKLCVILKRLHLRVGNKKEALKWGERAVSLMEKSLEDHNSSLMFEKLSLLKLYFELNKANQAERLGAEIQKDISYYKNSSKSNNTVCKYMVSFEKSKYTKDFRSAKRQADALIQFVSGDFDVTKNVIVEINYLRDYFLTLGDFDAGLMAAERFEKARNEYYFEDAPSRQEGTISLALLKLKYLYILAPDSIANDEHLISVNQVFNKQHPLYLKSLELCFLQRLFLNDLDKAEDYAKELLSLYENQKGKYNQQYLDGLYSLSKVYVTGGKLEALKKLIAEFEAIEDDTKKRDKDDRNRIYLGYMQGSLFELLGDYDAAQKVFARAFKKLNKSDKKQEFFVNIDPEVRASIHMFLGELSDAENILEDAKVKKVARYGESGYPLIGTYLSLSKLRLQQGNLPEAKKMVSKAETILLAKTKGNNIQLLQAMELQANLDIIIGDRELAFKKLSDLYSKELAVYGQNHFKPAITKIKQSWMAFYLGANVDEQIQNVNYSLLTISENLGNSHPDYAFGLWMKSALLLEQGSYDAALLCADSGLSVYEDIDPYHEMIVRISSLKGDIYHSWGNADKAEVEYGIALKKANRIYADNHPALANIKFKVAIVKIGNDNDKGLKDLEEVMRARELFLQNDFLFLTQREKQKYYAGISKELQYYPYVKIAMDKSNGALDDLLEHRMKTKGVLLKSKTDFEGEILKSGNIAQKERLNAWRSAKTMYANALMGTETSASNADDLANLLRDAERLENDILQNLDSDKKKDKRNAQSIQKMLLKDEALVEIIRCTNYKNEPFYYALVVSGNDISVAQLPNAKSLEKESYRYLQRSLEFEADDIESYALYWQPIDSILSEKVDKIYFSPDGIYHLINPDMLKSSVDGKYLIEKYKFIRLSSPIDALSINNTNENLGRSLSSLVIGNPKFSESNEGNVPQLAGAETEANDIYASMNGKGWNSVLLKNEMATEDSLLHSGSPNVLHIATHGFFKDSQNDVQGDMGIRSLSGGNNPLINSGLLLAHGGESYRDDAPINGMADGIFTALEAQNLDLSNCQLVVLSACETGKGSISIGNGVFGLQKSFLDAGAGNVLMTLQPVSDAVTQELMGYFYKDYLEGARPEDALYNAKLKVKEKYPHPHFWAPFVLVK